MDHSRKRTGGNRYTKTIEKYITWKKWHNLKKESINRRRNKRSEGHRRVLIATCRMRQPRSSAAKFKTFPEQEDRIKHSLSRILIFATASPGGFRSFRPPSGGTDGCGASGKVVRIRLDWKRATWSPKRGGIIDLDTKSARVAQRLLASKNCVTRFDTASGRDLVS